MSDPKQGASFPLEILTRSIFGGIDPLLRMVLHKESVQPPYPSLSIPDDQLKLLGALFRDMQMNYPENAAEIHYEVDDPSGKLGRMLTDDERRRLLQLMTRRLEPK